MKHLTLLALLLAASAIGAAKTVIAKWSQKIDGTVTAAISIKRGGGVCEGETAKVEQQTLVFRMTCAGDECALAVPLQQPGQPAASV